MKVFWHKIDFSCSCGLPATILEVCVSRDGGITMSGICVVCGEELQVEDTLMNLIGKSAVTDFLACKEAKGNSTDLLLDFEANGKPN